MSEITPALTPEQWAKGRAATHDGRASIELMPSYVLPGVNGLYVFRMGHSAILVPELFAAGLALANAALPDDDPRKITRADVEALAAAVFELPESGAAWYVMTHEQFALVSRLPVKLAALLPPETSGE